MLQFPETLCIAGSDTSVGKTFVSAVLTLGLKGCYWKPIQCGVSPCTDTEWVHEATGLPHNHFLKESYRFGEVLPPHEQHANIELAAMKPENRKQSHLIVEGTGGIMVPLNDKELFLDFMKVLKAPTLLVIRNNTGAINQALITLEKLEREKIPVFGVVLNGERSSINRRAIESYAHPLHIFEIDFVSHITEYALRQTFDRVFI